MLDWTRIVQEAEDYLTYNLMPTLRVASEVNDWLRTQCASTPAVQTIDDGTCIQCGADRTGGWGALCRACDKAVNDENARIQKEADDEA